MAIISHIREVYPDGNGATTYHELLDINGRSAQINITRSAAIRTATVSVWANGGWSLVASLAPAKPDPALITPFQSVDTFQMDRDELIRRFNLIMPPPVVVAPGTPPLQ